MTARFVQIYGWTETGATVILVPTKLAGDIQKIKALGLPPEEEQALIMQAKLGAAQTGLMMLGSSVAARRGAKIQGQKGTGQQGKVTAKSSKAQVDDLQKQVELIKLEGLGDYKSIQERGWIDANNNWTSKAPLSKSKTLKAELDHV